MARFGTLTPFFFRAPPDVQVFVLRENIQANREKLYKSECPPPSRPSRPPPGPH